MCSYFNCIFFKRSIWTVYCIRISTGIKKFEMEKWHRVIYSAVLFSFFPFERMFIMMTLLAIDSLLHFFLCRIFKRTSENFSRIYFISHFWMRLDEVCVCILQSVKIKLAFTTRWKILHKFLYVRFKYVWFAFVYSWFLIIIFTFQLIILLDLIKY